MLVASNAGPGRGVVWRAAASPGGMLGLLALCASLAGLAFLILRVLPAQDQSGPRAVVVVASVVVGTTALVLAYLLFGYFTMSYALEPQRLVVRWGWSHYTIPLDTIEYVGPAQDLIDGQRLGASVPWPGYYLEVYSSTVGRPVRTYATQPLHRQVAVHTAEAVYALSPDRPIRFMQDLAALREHVATLKPSTDLAGAAAAQGTTRLPSAAAAASVDTAESRGGLAAAPRLSAPLAVLADRTGWTLLGIALFLNVSMLAYVLWRMPGPTERLPLHFNALGQVDRIGEPRELLLLNGVTFLVTTINLLLALATQRYDTFVARFLLTGSIMTGLVAWVAVVNLL